MSFILEISEVVGCHRQHLRYSGLENLRKFLTSIQEGRWLRFYQKTNTIADNVLNGRFFCRKYSYSKGSYNQKEFFRKTFFSCLHSFSTNS